MKNIFALLGVLLLLCSGAVRGQQRSDLLKELQSVPQDTHRVSLLVDLAWTFMQDEPETAKKYFTEAIPLARQFHFDLGEAAAINGLGVVADLQSQTDIALQYYRQALAIREKVGDKSLIASSFINIGAILESEGKYYQAIDSLDKSIQILTEINDTIRLARAKLNIAGVYETLGIYITAKGHAQEARYIFEKIGDEESLAKTYNVQGHILFENEKFAQAKPMYELALKMYRNQGDTSGIANTLMNIANNYDEWGNQTEQMDTILKAIPLYQQALQLYAYRQDSAGIASLYNNLGDNYKHSKQYSIGISYLRKSLDIWQHLGFKEGIMETYNSFGDIHFGLKNYKKSLDYTEKYYKIALELENSKFIQKALKDFSKIYAATGDFEKAYQFRKQYDEMRYLRLSENRAHEFERGDVLYADRKRKDELDRQKLKNAEQSADIARARATRNGLIGGAVALLLVTLLIYNRSRLRARSNKQLAIKNAAIERERRRADELLMNILPESAAAELKLYNSVKPVRYDSVTVIFTDFKGFTKIAELVSPEELIAELDSCFRLFDSIMERFGLEKIKTIGDSYMCAGGLPTANDTHPIDAVEAAIEMQRQLKILMEDKAAEGKPVFEMRVGIHTGPVVAGVVGSHKFAYDIWGDTVNIAARVEQASEPTKINISSTTYELVKHRYTCIQRGQVAAKNKGTIEMYFVAF